MNGLPGKPGPAMLDKCVRRQPARPVLWYVAAISVALFTSHAKAATYMRPGTKGPMAIQLSRTPNNFLGQNVEGTLVSLAAADRAPGGVQVRTGNVTGSITGAEVLLTVAGLPDGERDTLRGTLTGGRLSLSFPLADGTFHRLVFLAVAESTWNQTVRRFRKRRAPVAALAQRRARAAAYYGATAENLAAVIRQLQTLRARIPQETDEWKAAEVGLQEANSRFEKARATEQAAERIEQASQAVVDAADQLAAACTNACNLDSVRSAIAVISQATKIIGAVSQDIHQDEAVLMARLKGAQDSLVQDTRDISSEPGRLLDPDTRSAIAEAASHAAGAASDAAGAASDVAGAVSDCAGEVSEAKSDLTSAEANAKRTRDALGRDVPAVPRLRQIKQDYSRTMDACLRKLRALSPSVHVQVTELPTHRRRPRRTRRRK